jgi:fucose 4-O-acetylase-like acetyltransferase
MESAKSNVMSRIVYLDSLRGFAILLVIIGHLIQFNYKSGIENHIFNLIYSFHMPLFFFISGLCTNFVKETSTLRELFNYGYKKFYQLIIPSIVWTIVVPLFFSCKYTVSNISINTISGYWFLNTLFVVCMLWGIFSYLKNLTGRFMLLNIIGLILFLCLFVMGVKRISLMYFAMFVFGYYFYKYDLSIKNKYALSFITLCFCLLSGHFVYGSTTTGDESRVWLEFPLSIMASIIFVGLFRYIGKEKMTKFLSYIGKYTLGIYVCHFLFVQFGGAYIGELNVGMLPQFFILLIISVVIALCCICVQKVTEPFLLLHGLMYGKWGIKSKIAEK